MITYMVVGMMIVVFASYNDDCDESLNANTLMTAELRAFEPLVWF